MWARIDGLRTLELGTPGELRDWLNSLVLDGIKTATAGLLDADYRAESEEPGQAGERMVLVDSGGQRLAEVEVTAVRIVPFHQVGWEFAEAEGEGFRSVEHWREVHTRYWTGLDQPFGPDSEVVCTSFRLVEP